jgi:HEAT repeat protein
MSMKFLVSAIVVVVVVATPAWGQTARPARSGDKTAAALGSGWSAIGQGQPAKAAEVAGQLLRNDPASHDAVALGVAALAADRRATDALDVYERWMQATTHEDIFELRTVALATLRALTSGTQPRVRVAALSALAAAGDPDARAALIAEASTGDASFEIDAALAALGDRDAIGRLESQITAGGTRDKSAAIDALASAGSRTSAAAIASALKDPAPPSRMAAANALAELGAIDAIPALQAALQEPDPAVRHMIAVALARLGDTSGGVTLESLEKSPVGDLRLIAAAAAADRSPSGDWPVMTQPLLTDPDPMVRLRAASLLLKHGRETDPAHAVLSAGLADPSPALRTAAVQLTADLVRDQDAADIPALRRMLRDPLPEIRVAAAGALLGRPRPARR